MNSNRLMETWYHAVMALLLGAFWLGFCGWSVEQISGSASLQAADPLPSFLLSAVVVMLSVVSVSFSGPRRSSVGELNWRPKQKQTGKLLQTALVVVLFFFLFGSFLAYFLLNIGWQTTEIVLGLSILAGTVAIFFALLTLLQKSGRGTPQSPLVAGAALGPLVALVAHALGFIPQISIGAALALLLLGALWSLFSLRSLSPSTPRWALIRADANVSSLAMSLTMLDASAMRLLADLRQKSTLHRQRVFGSGSWSLFWTMTRRVSVSEWQITLLVMVVAVSSNSLFGLEIAQGLAVLAGILVAMRSVTGWTEFLEAPAQRAFIFPAARWSMLAVFAAHIVLPQLAAVLSLLVLFQPSISLLWWILCALLAPMQVLLARGLVAVKRADKGPLGTFIHIPEAGLIPTGVVGNMVAGWFSAGVVVLVGLVFSPQFTAIALALLVANNFVQLSNLFHKRKRGLVSISQGTKAQGPFS